MVSLQLKIQHWNLDKYEISNEQKLITEFPWPLKTLDTKKTYLPWWSDIKSVYAVLMHEWSPWQKATTAWG